MSDQDKLKQLSDRIAAAKKAGSEEAPRGDEHYSMANLAWRMVIELVAGIGIGFGIGYGLDVLFGTMPLFLILFIGFGLAAGIRVMMRTAEEVQAEQAAKAAKPGDDDG
ncbi:MAG: AtpZ/AtpI family protein [Shimia sp.]